MGLRRLFKKARRTIKKLIPKEIRPAVPYIAAAIPGLGMGLGALGAKSAMGSFLRAGIVKGLTDDEANLGDILRTGAIAAAPQAIGKGLESIGTNYKITRDGLSSIQKFNFIEDGNKFNILRYKNNILQVYSYTFKKYVNEMDLEITAFLNTFGGYNKLSKIHNG